MPVPAIVDDGITIKPPVITTASLKPSPLNVHFRHSKHLDQQQTYNELGAQILAKAQNIVDPLRDSYPEAVKILSFLLKQIVDSKMHTAENEKSIKKFKNESFQPETTAAVEIFRSSEEYTFKRPERYGDDDLDDAKPQTTTTIHISSETGTITPDEIENSEQMETEDISLAQNEGLSISIESTKKAISFTHPKTTTVSEIQSPKPSKNIDAKSKKNNKNEKGMDIAKLRKKIKSFKNLQQVLEKEVSAKQKERLRIKEAQQKKQMHAKKESDEEEFTKSEMEKIRKEVKQKKKKKSSEPITSVSEDDKNAAIRKLIEEIMLEKEKAKKRKNQITKRKPKELQVNHNVKNEEESSEEGEETESENDETTTVTSSRTLKFKTQKQTEGNKKTIGSNKESYDIGIESEVKKKFKHTVHKESKIATKYPSTLLVMQQLGKNFKVNNKLSKKGRKLKSTTPHMLVSVKTKSPKTTRKRAFEFEANRKPPQDENISTDANVSIDSSNSASSKEKTFTPPQQLKQLNAMAFMPPLDTEDESPMLLPPVVNFQLATKDRLVTMLEPNLSDVEAERVFGDNEDSVNYEDKLATSGIMSMSTDDVNINIGVSEGGAFRRRMYSTDATLEEFIKAGSKQSLPSI